MVEISRKERATIGQQISLSLLQSGLTCKYSSHSEKICLIVPAVLNIYANQHRGPTVGFIDSISDLIDVNRILNYGIKLHLDFSEVKILTAATAVMIFGEITAIQLKTGIPDIITVSLPKDASAKKIFANFDFYKAIKPGTGKKLNKLFDENCFFQSGIVPAKLAISAIMSLTKTGLKIQATETNLFKASILEAMSNVRWHSYGEDTHDTDKRWWQFTYFDKMNSSIHFVVYDRGMGIPATIRKHSPMGMNEGQLIENAMKIGVTSKKEAGRGKGSGEILKTYNQTDNSSLLIYSGCGVYYKDKEDGIKIVEQTSTPIKGTIIEWQVPYKIS